MAHNEELDALRLSEARLGAIIALAADAIVSVNEQQSITLFNQSAERIFGYAASEIMGKPLELLLPHALAGVHANHVRNFARAAVPSRRMGERQEVYGRRKSGEIFPAEASISRVEVNGKAYYTAVVRDVSDAKRTQANMVDLLRREHQARAARDAILSAVSHDLTNPLSAIRMCTSTLLTSHETLPPPTLTSLLGTIRDSAEWMQRMIQDLLDIANIEAGYFAVRRMPGDVLQVIRRAVDLFTPIAAERDVALAVEAPEMLPPVYIDSDRTLQVLSNLLGNAVKFSDPGSVVALTAQLMPDAVTIAVRDQGQGLQSDELQHLFDRTWDGWRTGTVRARGSGLGLAIAKGIVDMQEGRLWCESTPGHGSTFSFTIPLLGPPVAEPRSPLGE